MTRQLKRLIGQTTRLGLSAVIGVTLIVTRRAEHVGIIAPNMARWTATGRAWCLTVPVNPGRIMQLPDTTSPKRIVLEHKTGALVGMFQILAMSNEEGVPVPLPTFMEGIYCEQDGKVCNASMVEVKRGAIYYRELVVVTGLKTFDGGQR